MGDCNKRGSAFLSQGGKCVYSFGHAQLQLAETEKEMAKFAFMMNFTSDQDCKTEGGEGKFAVTVQAVCQKPNADPKATPLVDPKWSTAGLKKCSAVLKVKTEAACIKITDLAAFMVVLKFLGVILIVLGALMTFAGAKFLFYAIAAIIMVGVSGASFVLAFNLFLSSLSGVVQVAGLVGCILLGCAASYFTYQLAQSYAAAIISTAVGVSIALAVTSAMKNPVVKAVVLVLGGLVGFYIGKTFNKYVKSIGTAVIGSTMLVAGILVEMN